MDHGAIERLGSQAFARMVSELSEDEDATLDDAPAILEPGPEELQLFKIATHSGDPVLVNAVNWLAALGNALAHFGHPPIELMTSELLDGGGILIRDVARRRDFLIWPYADPSEEELVEVPTRDLVEIGVEELEILEALGDLDGVALDALLSPN